MFQNSNKAQKIILTCWLAISFGIYFCVNIIYPPVLYGVNEWGYTLNLVLGEIFMLLVFLAVAGIPVFFIYRLWADKKL